MTNTSSVNTNIPSGQQVFTACAFIHKLIGSEEKVFLAKRAATKKFLPNVFELPGGHINFNEDLKLGLAREIMEEFQKDIVINDPFYVFTYHNEITGTHSIEVVYYAQFTNDSMPVILNQADHSEYGWYGVNELDKAYSEAKGEDDEEFIAIRKGFELINGGKLKY